MTTYAGLVLCRLGLVQQHYSRHVVLVDQSPEVADGVRERPLGHRHTDTSTRLYTRAATGSPGRRWTVDNPALSVTQPHYTAASDRQ